jgi:polar amino acid transport system permease protein
VPVLSTITVFELLATAKLLASQSFKYFEAFTAVGLIFLAISYSASLFVRRLEQRFSSQAALI